MYSTPFNPFKVTIRRNESDSSGQEEIEPEATMEMEKEGDTDNGGQEEIEPEAATEEGDTVKEFHCNFNTHSSIYRAVT